MTLAEWLDKSGLLASDLARMIGSPHSTVTRIMTGQRRPTWRIMRRISEATCGEVSQLEDYISFRSDDPRPRPRWTDTLSQEARDEALKLLDACGSLKRSRQGWVPTRLRAPGGGPSIHGSISGYMVRRLISEGIMRYGNKSRSFVIRNET